MKPETRKLGTYIDEVIPGSASLSDYLDKKVLIILRDGKSLTGRLRSYDQFANLVIQSVTERAYFEGEYGESKAGIFIIRGENVVLMGAINPGKEKEAFAPMKRLPLNLIKKKISNELFEKNGHFEGFIGVPFDTET